MKEAYFFRHDANARHDVKLLKIRAKYGIEGYGTYFCIIEILRESTDYKLLLTEIEFIAYDLQIDYKKLLKIFDDFFEFDLLVKDNVFFYSNRLNSDMSIYHDFIDRQTGNGKKGGRPKTQINPNETQTKPTGLPNETQTEAIYISPYLSTYLSLSDAEKERERNLLNLENQNKEEGFVDTPEEPTPKYVFKKPSLREVMEYFKKQKFHSDPEAFYLLREEEGWEKNIQNNTSWIISARLWENGFSKRNNATATVPEKYNYENDPDYLRTLKLGKR